jgi:hypothetical protein
MKDIEEEVLRRLLVELFLAAPRRRTRLQQDSQEGARKKAVPTVRQRSDNQTGENHDEKEAET